MIKVHVSSVNRTDCGFLLAKPWIVRFFSGLLVPKNKVLGCEFAGEVVEIGKGVKRFKVGDRVFGFDDDTFGGHGEYMAIGENKMLTNIPDNVGYETAGVATEGSHYFLEYLRASGVSKGDKVFVNGGTGAIGSAAIQILVSMGVRVDATAGSENIELVKSLGAKKVIDYTKEDFTELDEKFDWVFDSVGKCSYHMSKKF
ncbi:MAG: NAD(P)-dependent alcohol dehydrogenase [Thermales bacterium]|nr:NAD(P)-dependent alcohol dehydrogenase [Thermales bacterium]